MSRHEAILSAQWHQISDRAHRHQVKVVAQFDAKCHGMVFLAQVFEQAMREFKHQADGAKIAPCVISRFRKYMRIDKDRIGNGTFLGTVMVDHDNIDSHGF